MESTSPTTDQITCESSGKEDTEKVAPGREVKAILLVMRIIKVSGCGIGPSFAAGKVFTPADILPDV